MKKVLLVGEPLIRVSLSDYQLVGNQVDSRLYFGGSEVNIASALQGFGLSTRLLTALPPTPIGDRFEAFLQRKGVDTSAVQRVGERVGLYYLEQGIGCRQTEVHYDRGGSAIHEFISEGLDYDCLFQGVDLLHFSGITVALSSAVRDWLRVLLLEAKQRQILISFDVNWRAKLLNCQQAKSLFSEFALYADYCFGIDPLMVDATDTRLFDRSQASETAIAARMQELKSVYSFQAVFHTVRRQDFHGLQTYQAYGLSDEFVVSTELDTQILERVGSGDAFVAGALYQLLMGKSLQEVVDLAVASGTYKCTLIGDSMYVPVNRIQALLQKKEALIR